MDTDDVTEAYINNLPQHMQAGVRSGLAQCPDFSPEFGARLAILMYRFAESQRLTDEKP
jgi:hypothetical protein